MMTAPDRYYRDAHYYLQDQIQEFEPQYVTPFPY